ncbi:hypothetical protein [Salinisphaera shabanensis]|uniref:hypothetical protein n=1 Tax=Salinisphaera shabanensis TaxID=180542 RepID=UPI00333E77E4
MSYLNEILFEDGATVDGTYRLIGDPQKKAKRELDGELQFTVSDCTGHRSCIALTREHPDLRDQLRKGALVAVTGQIEHLDDSAGHIRIQSCHRINYSERPSWELIPLPLVPQTCRCAFSRLTALLDRLSDNSMRMLCNRIMANLSVTANFVSEPNRYEGVTARTGSLLVTSVARAEKVEAMTEISPSLEDREALIVAALLRDVGGMHTKSSSASQEHGGMAAQNHTLELLGEELLAWETHEDRRANFCAILAPQLATLTNPHQMSLMQAHSDLIRDVDHLASWEPHAGEPKLIRSTSGTLLARAASITN